MAILGGFDVPLRSPDDKPSADASVQLINVRKLFG
jgi:hypothetical protein